MTTPTTLVMAYYENARMLERHYHLIRNLPFPVRDQISVIIVDDGSPNAPAYGADLNGVALQVYRLRQDVRWNQDACRNIGVAHAETDWVFLTDMDHMVPERTWVSVVLRNHAPERAYQFARVSEPDMMPYKHHPNTWFMTRKLYDKIGGYDERFAGYYGTDGDFSTRLRGLAKVAMFKEPVIRVPRGVTPDASTTTYLRKQPEDKPMIEKIMNERSQIKDWKPLRGLFAYDKVFSN